MPKFLNIIAVLILLGGVVISQYFYDQTRSGRPKDQPLILPAEVVKAADLGLDSAASDYFWLASVQYLGDYQTDGYKDMAKYIELSTEMNPKFSYPYAFGVLMLPDLKMTSKAIEIGKKGIAEADPDWRIPYYMGTMYHINLKDYTNAAKSFDLAAKTAGAPQSIQQIAASYATRPDLREQTKQIWIGILENSNDELVKERASAYVYHYELLDLFESAAKVYKDKYGSYPDPIEKLVEGKILKEIPVDPFGFKFQIDETGRAEIVN